ncbi:MAG: hypothetical protein HY909_15400 [Deltaproteobacteria bacterium]|nr:hypothetical protein [Deltaproteobacteria bacterium]
MLLSGAGCGVEGPGGAQEPQRASQAVLPACMTAASNSDPRRAVADYATCLATQTPRIPTGAFMYTLARLSQDRAPDTRTALDLFADVAVGTDVACVAEEAAIAVPCYADGTRRSGRTANFIGGTFSPASDLYPEFNDQGSNQHVHIGFWFLMGVFRTAGLSQIGNFVHESEGGGNIQDFLAAEVGILVGQALQRSVNNQQPATLMAVCQAQFNDALNQVRVSLRVANTSSPRFVPDAIARNSISCDNDYCWVVPWETTCLTMFGLRASGGRMHPMLNTPITRANWPELLLHSLGPSVQMVSRPARRPSRYAWAPVGAADPRRWFPSLVTAPREVLP